MRPQDLSAAPDGPLGNLVATVLERVEREGARALDDACRAHPEHAAALRQRVAALRELGLVDSAPSERTPERLGDFRLLECIGSGGMGVVYHAVQESLGRDVALKLIRPEMLHMPGARERFARETTIIARLQHPGIVPIYTVGGVGELPYYSMERVPGCTLAEALAELGRDSSRGLTGADLARAVRARTKASATGAEPDGELFAGTWEQVALRIVRQVALALEHAHGRAVLHRDLKPSNVMLTLGGRVMLVDFGLSHSDGTDSVTRSGERAGSLPYMPPELLQHGMRAVDQRSDVYSLGVTLYQLLTLRLPFAAPNEPLALARILEGRPVGLRACEPSLSWEAETLCLAAMERDPERRYATAADFARDLGNALEHRPVEARRASAALKVKRWIQRNPARAVAVALAALLAIGGPNVLAWVQSRALAKEQELNRELAEANRVAGSERELAQARFEKLRTLAGSLLTDIHDELMPVVGATSARRKLIDLSLEYLRGLEAEAGDDASLRYELARGYDRAGTLLGNPGVASLGDTRGALAAYEKQREILEALSADFPGVATYALDLVWNHLFVSAVLGKRERTAALAHSTEALRIARALPAATSPEQLALQREVLIQALGDHVELVADDAPREELEALLAEQSAAAEAWLADEPRSDKALTAFGFVCTTDASDLARRGEMAAASARLETWRVTLQRFEDAGASTLVRREFGRLAAMHGHMFAATGEFEAALEQFRAWRANNEELLRDDAKDANALIFALEAARQAAAMLSKLERVDDAIAELQPYVERSTEWIDAYGEREQILDAVAKLIERAGTLRMDGQRDVDGARELFERFHAIHAQLAQRGQESEFRRERLGASRYYLAWVLETLGGEPARSRDERRGLLKAALDHAQRGAAVYASLLDSAEFGEKAAARKPPLDAIVERVSAALTDQDGLR